MVTVAGRQPQRPIAAFLVAQAQEGGPFFDFNRKKSGFAPDVQLGYSVPFAGGDWQAGIKFNYKYANIDSKQNVSIPQSGTLTTVIGRPTTENITGFVQISPAEINLRHQLALMATVGRAFDKLTIYAGGGPALFGVETKFVNGTAFAVIRGVSCCRFDGRLVKLIPPCVRTQQD